MTSSVRRSCEADQTYNSCLSYHASSYKVKKCGQQQSAENLKKAGEAEDELIYAVDVVTSSR
ncbi:MAG: hypothetical protein KAR06_02850 [Deltaproteobacteria bacterium]|nr:hypothetical protein [Deltaproteobacteria bacterium]